MPRAALVSASRAPASSATRTTPPRHATPAFASHAPAPSSRFASRGLYQLHASAAVDPDGIAWMFAGPSGAGKSTLAYALARQGWHILGDDGVVLEPTATGRFSMRGASRCR